MNDGDRRAYSNAVQENNYGIMCNSHRYDKNVFLTAVVCFVLSIQMYDPAANLVIQYSALVFSAFSIISNLVSFVTSTFALEVRRELIDKYYIEDDDLARNKKVAAGIVTNYLNWQSGACVVLALVSIVIFHILNM